jgi:hypothetical protein
MYGSRSPGFSGSDIKRLKLIQAVNGWRKVVLNAGSRLSLPEAAQTEYRLSNSVISQLNSLFRQSHCKRFGTLGYQPSGAVNSSMTVGVGFYYSHDGSLRADALANEAKVRRQSFEIDLSPGGPPRKNVVFD